MLKGIKIPAHFHYKDILMSHLRIENHLYFAYKTSSQQAQMVPLKPTIGSASLTKFIATRFFYYYVFSIFMDFTTFDVCSPLNLHFRKSEFSHSSCGRGHEGPCRKQLMPGLLWLFLLLSSHQNPTLVSQKSSEPSSTAHSRWHAKYKQSSIPG